MMLKQDQVEKVTLNIWTIQITSFALITGVLFAAVIFFAITDWTMVTKNLDTMTLVGLIIGLAAIVKSTILPRIIGNAAVNVAQQKSLKSSDDRLVRLASAFQTRTIFKFAFLEAAAFLNLIFFFVTKSILPLAVVAVAILLMAFAFPRTESIYDWIGERME